MQHPTDTHREGLVETLSKPGRSALQNYRDLFVGHESSSLEFVKYEILTLLLGSMPGAAGLFLRKVLYRSLLGEMGRGAVIGPRVTLRSPGSVVLGNSVFVDSDVVLDAKGPDSAIRLGDSVLVGRGTILSCSSAQIETGNEISIGPNCLIRAAMGPVSIGSFVSVGAHSVIISGTKNYDRLELPIKKQGGGGQGITIQDDVWVGVGVRIIDGVNVGTGSIVGAGAVVVEDVPDFGIVGGVPAKLIGSRRTSVRSAPV